MTKESLLINTSAPLLLRWVNIKGQFLHHFPMVSHGIELQWPIILASLVTHPFIGGLPFCECLPTPPPISVSCTSLPNEPLPLESLCRVLFWGTHTPTMCQALWQQSNDWRTTRLKDFRDPWQSGGKMFDGSLRVYSNNLPYIISVRFNFVNRLKQCLAYSCNEVIINCYICYPAEVKHWLFNRSLLRYKFPWKVVHKLLVAVSTSEEIDWSEKL